MANNTNKLDSRKLATQLSVIPAHVIRLIEADGELLAKASPKIEALISYLTLDDTTHVETCLGKMGKSPECLMVRPEGGPSAVLFGTIDCSARANGLSRAAKANAKKLSAAEKQLEDLSPETIMEQVQIVFELYCDKNVMVRTGLKEIDAFGFIRMLRDAGLLDNQLTIVQADMIFCGEAKAAKDRRDLHRDYEEFLSLLKSIANWRYPPPPLPIGAPLETPADKEAKGEEALLAICKVILIPMLNKITVEVKNIDAIYTREVLDVMRRHDYELLRVFSWYATLDEKDRQKRVAWEYVRQEGLTVGRSELMLMMLNFNVLPVLVNKADALEVMVKQRQVGHATMRGAGTMSQPSAMETLAALGIFLADHMVNRLRQETLSTEQLRPYKKYAACCKGSLKDTIDELLELNTAKFCSPSSTPASFDGLETSSIADSPYQHQILTMRSQVVKKQDQDKMTKHLGVLARREEERQKFALTRLKNYYRDVRKDLPSPYATGRAASGGAGAGRMTGEEWGGMDGEQQVAFFAGTRQIKTPKTQHGHPPPAHARNELESSSPRAGDAHSGNLNLTSNSKAHCVTAGGHSSAVNQKSESDQVLEAAQNMDHKELLQFVSSFIQSTHGHGSSGGLWHSQRENLASSLGLPPFNRTGGHLRIEDRDESEAILSLAKRLPSINLPSINQKPCSSRSASSPEQVVALGASPQLPQKLPSVRKVESGGAC
eukprot:gene15223-21303_t